MGVAVALLQAKTKSKFNDNTFVIVNVKVSGNDTAAALLALEVAF